MILSNLQPIQPHQLLQTEWLVTNGLGGFASSTISCSPTRKHHSLLVASFPSPLGRINALPYASESITLPDMKELALSHFHIEDGIPFWTYESDGTTLEKSLLLIHQQNTVLIHYKLRESKQNVQLKWRPYFHFRLSDQEVDTSHAPYKLRACESHYEISSAGLPSLQLSADPSAPFTNDPHILENVFYEMEESRGYPSVGRLTSPGFFSYTLKPGEHLTIAVSFEPSIGKVDYEAAIASEKQRKQRVLNKAGELAKSKAGASLCLAADQFIMAPPSREESAHVLKDPHSIIAGFPLYMDWGRDTMIALEGLALTTGRWEVASSILKTFAFYIKDGLVPTRFETDNIFYTSADSTLWFFHAIERYIEASGDRDILEYLLPKLQDILEHHIRGTLFGIKVDDDGLLTQGEKEIALTWMDVTQGTWLATPRRGKAVEINALWYNALKLFESWTGKFGDYAEKCYDSFNKRFWYEEGKYLYDVVDENDADLRPNQLFAISLKYPVLEKNKWAPVLKTVEEHLLTPFGLRSLAPSHPNYKPHYVGDLTTRNKAYQQGTVWPWLIGPFIDAYLKTYPEDVAKAQSFLKGLENHMENYCCGTIAEICDGDPPHTPRGCFAQAWSVAEYLRSFAKINSQFPT